MAREKVWCCERCRDAALRHGHQAGRLLGGPSRASASPSITSGPGQVLPQA